MKWQTNESTGDVRNYRYGLRAPTVGADVVDEQFYLAHKYRNQLAEIELRRRAAHDAVLAELAPDVSRLTQLEATAKENLSAAAEALKSARVAARSKRKDDAGQRAVVKALRDRLKAIRAELKVAKAHARTDATIQKRLAIVDAEDLCARKRARAESGLYWGTYCQVEQAASAMRRGKPPRFLRYSGGGKIAVQIQITRPMRAADAYTCQDTRLRIEPINHDAPGKTARYTRLWLRVGSTETRDPVWAIFPLYLHRDPPPEATIKWAYVVRRRVGTKHRYHLILVLAEVPETRPMANTGYVSVDPGWRAKQDGLRVAYWIGSDGEEGEVELPAAAVSRWGKADGLRATRDANMNAAKAQLIETLGRMDARPEWLVEATKTLPHWRSAARLASLAIRWRENRFGGDAAAYEALEAWRKQDKHLLEWEANNRRKAVAWRDSYYRDFASQMAQRYRELRLEATDWRRLAKRPEPEEDDGEHGDARRNRTIAAVGRLGEILRERFAVVAGVAPEYTTQDCAHCGQRDAFDAARQLVRTCKHCGKTEDQDRRAARNIASGA